VPEDFRHEPPNSLIKKDDPLVTDVLEVRLRNGEGPDGRAEGEDGLTLL